MNIKKQLNDKKFTKVEKERFLKDLESVFLRLQKRDYKIASYSKNAFNVPDRLNDIYTELEFYALIGKTWAKVLCEININKFSEVADLCPGFSPKIELALFYAGFEGQVVMIDKDFSALSKLERFMRLFQPKFSLIKKRVDLFNEFKESYDVVLANHVIDDLVIAYFAEKNGIKLRDVYAKEGKIVILWNKILKNKEQNLAEILSVVASVFRKITKRDGIICFTQYKSYMEKLLDMDGAFRFNRVLFNALVKKLTKEDFIQDKTVVRKALKNFKGHFGEKDCVVLRKNI